MANYRARLPLHRPYKGIQVTLSTPLGVRVDVSVTDDKGFFR